MSVSHLLRRRAGSREDSPGAHCCRCVRITRRLCRWNLQRWYQLWIVAAATWRAPNKRSSECCSSSAAGSGGGACLWLASAAGALPATVCVCAKAPAAEAAASGGLVPVSVTCRRGSPCALRRMQPMDSRSMIACFLGRHKVYHCQRGGDLPLAAEAQHWATRACHALRLCQWGKNPNA